MKPIPKGVSLHTYQQFVHQVCVERGWDQRTGIEKMLFMTEEVGEVAKEIRKQAGTYGYKTPADSTALAGELIDVLNYILDIATMYDINLDDAFEQNWQKNLVRSWD